MHNQGVKSNKVLPENIKVLAKYVKFTITGFLKVGDIASWGGAFLEGQGAKTATKNPPRVHFVDEFTKPCAIIKTIAKGSPKR